MARISKRDMRSLIFDGVRNKPEKAKNRANSGSALPQISNPYSRTPSKAQAPQQPLTQPKAASLSRSKKPSIPKRPSSVKKHSKRDMLMQMLSNRRKHSKSGSGQSSKSSQLDQPASPPPAVTMQNTNNPMRQSYFPTPQELDTEAARLKQQTANSRQEAAKWANEYFDQNKEGLTPEEKAAYQDQVDQQINRELAKYNRLIDVDAGARGMRGGIVNTPKTELSKAALDAQREFQRDLTIMDRDEAYRKLAAKLALQEGLVADDLISRQQAFDYYAGRNAAEEQGRYNERFLRDYYGGNPFDQSKSDRLSKKERFEMMMNKRRKSNRVGSRV